MCSTHQPHWANKGKRMFQIYFCFSDLWELHWWHAPHRRPQCSFLLILFPFCIALLSPCFSIFMDGFPLPGNTYLLSFTLYPCEWQRQKRWLLEWKVMWDLIPQTRSVFLLTSRQCVFWSTRQSPLVSNPLNIQLRKRCYCGRKEYFWRLIMGGSPLSIPQHMWVIGLNMRQTGSCPHGLLLACPLCPLRLVSRFPIVGWPHSQQLVLRDPAEVLHWESG